MKPVFASLKIFVGKPYRSVRMYLPIALVAFALCFPALAAAGITPERPVSDLTLMLNETVSIKFPGGTTDSIKKNGKWRYRILKNPGLPKGLTFDHATRTLSGTPVEEHDATHSYRIRYVWGRNQADQQEKLIIPFRLVVREPPPIAVEITPQRPLSDITLELNETVSIKFPGGTTDQTQENGEWKYRVKRYGVKNDNSLPAGLDFDRATRTLSGTPSEEHDATYAYHIQYVWGEGKDNMKRLVIPFRLIVEHPIAARIRAFIGEASSVGEFAEGLPNLHKNHSLYMVASQALDGDFVSEEHPRMLSFGADARTIFAWGSYPDSDRYDLVEFIAADGRRWHFGVIDFAEDPPVVTRDPKECQSCHNSHPLWANRSIWPGTLYELRLTNSNYLWRLVRPKSYDDALYQGFVESSDSRISAVGTPPTMDNHDYYYYGLTAFKANKFALEFANQLAIRHGELLANEVIAKPDFYTVAEKFVCLGPEAVNSHWPKELIDLNRIGGLGLINSQSLGRLYNSSNAVLEDVIRLLVINHLYETDSEIQDIYDRTSNVDSVREWWREDLLHFEPGTATAADELRSRVELVKLVSQANIDKRRALRTAHFKDMLLDPGHLEVMAPKVCNALRARDND